MVNESDDDELEILHLCFRLGMPTRMVARALGVSKNTVNKVDRTDLEYRCFDACLCGEPIEHHGMCSWRRWLRDSGVVEMIETELRRRRRMTVEQANRNGDPVLKRTLRRLVRQPPKG